MFQLGGSTTNFLLHPKSSQNVPSEITVLKLIGWCGGASIDLIFWTCECLRLEPEILEWPEPGKAKLLRLNS